MDKVTEIPRLICELYEIVDRLETLFPGRRFTPDGHLVGSIGEVLAAHYYGLELLTASAEAHDAEASDGRLVQIKATQRTSVGLRSEPEHLRVDVKGQSTRNFWLVQKRAVQEDLYFVLVYLPKDVDELPRFFVLSCAEMMEERADYQQRIESQGGKYRDDMGGMNWSTVFEYEDKWDTLPRGQDVSCQDVIRIPLIPLNWSDWTPWASLAADARRGGGVSVPSKPGVYEVKRRGSKIRLTIGKASNLRRRVKQGLVKGSLPHSTGERMREKKVDFTDVVVRWAVTDRPSAVEEELHDRHERDHGQLPLYTKQT